MWDQGQLAGSASMRLGDQAIPAGALIERDDRWAEAVTLLRSTLPVEPTPATGPSGR
jgi:hypothetical protein